MLIECIKLAINKRNGIMMFVLVTIDPHITYITSEMDFPSAF